MRGSGLFIRNTIAFKPPLTLAGVGHVQIDHEGGTKRRARGVRILHSTIAMSEMSDIEIAVDECNKL